ncbi:CG5783 [Drosophila busckii]|uniref:CG5783 n=1 Tax=Drosophila busckii TaxID=30019 RepID=A0A0M4EE47_DROBS|nr:uncharacterized protein LOC108594386 [Drosophila busckii]ALC40235.1 CG5783 [Drosophila busckii]
MSAKLQNLALHKLIEFQAIYKQDWPKYCAEYYCLSNFIHFLKSDPNIKHLHAYTLDTQRAHELALFVIVDRYQLFVGSLENSEQLLKQALGLLDWSKELKCSSMPARHIEALKSVFKEKLLQLQFIDSTLLYYMPKQQAAALKVDVPPGFYLDALTEADANIVDEHWPNHHEGSLYFVQRQIRLCASVGLYEAEPKQLVAWCIRLQGGFLGALQVLDSHKRRGFGCLVTAEISRRLAAAGDDVMALVNPENKASIAVFNKLGFKIIDECYWARTQTQNFTWPKGE